MIAALLARFGFKLSRAAAVWLTVAVMLAIAGLGAWGTAATFAGIVSDARQHAADSRDAVWKAEIARANAEAERDKAIQRAAAAAAETRATSEITALKQSLNQMEQRNAALPDGARRGLGRDRVRLLNGG